jgi:hypothetical protein
MNVKFAHRLHFCVKGTLIREGTPDEEVQRVLDQYLKRCWGNHENFLYSDEFDAAWEARFGTDT